MAPMPLKKTPISILLRLRFAVPATDSCDGIGQREADGSAGRQRKTMREPILWPNWASIPQSGS